MDWKILATAFTMTMKHMAMMIDEIIIQNCGSFVFIDYSPSVPLSPPSAGYVGRPSAIDLTSLRRFSSW